MTEMTVADPASVGIDPRRLALLIERVRLDVEEGPLPAAQIAVARHGELVAYETFGDASPETRFVLQSAGRPVVASVLWKLVGEGQLRPTDRVGDIIPEFATNGKEQITVEQIATHTAGLPFAPLGYPKMLDRSARLTAFSRWEPSYEPGTRLAWHLTSSAWVIAELTERLSGMDIATFLRRVISEPLGLTLELRVPPDRQRDTVAPMVLLGEVDPSEIDPWGAWYLANPDVLAAGEPSHSMVGTAADVALHFQALVHSGIWTPAALEEGIRIRVSMAPDGEEIYGGSDSVVNVGLFVNVRGTNGAMVPVNGSERTFGHLGAPCSLAFFDPNSGVSFGFVTNGYPPAGYDYSPPANRRVTNIGNLAFDLIAEP